MNVEQAEPPRRHAAAVLQRLRTRTMSRRATARNLAGSARQADKKARAEEQAATTSARRGRDGEKDREER